ncbi:acyl carrier protein [bacterium]|nr:acyl carrier protein [bacterium]
MNKQEFLVALEDILQTEDPVEETQDLTELEEWDSLSKMAVMAYFKKEFAIELVLSALKDIKTPADLIALAGDKIND